MNISAPQASATPMQSRLYHRLLSLCAGEISKWILEEIQFPLQESWLEYIEEQILFDRKWRILWEKELLGIHPWDYGRVPSLPQRLTSTTIVPLRVTLKELQSKMSTRFLSNFSSLSPEWSILNDRVQFREILHMQKITLHLRYIPLHGLLKATKMTGQSKEISFHDTGIFMGKYPVTQAL